MIAANAAGTSTLINQYLGLYRIKAINESVTSSTTLQDDDDLQWVISDASSVWEVRVVAHYSNAAGSAPGFKFGWAALTGATLTWAAFGADNSTGNWHGDGGKTLGDTDVVQTNSGTRRMELSGILTMGSTVPGTLKFQWAQNASNATATVVKAGTYGCLRRIS